jgi:hypothetical protein
MSGRRTNPNPKMYLLRIQIFRCSRILVHCFMYLRDSLFQHAPPFIIINDLRSTGVLS